MMKTPQVVVWRILLVDDDEADYLLTRSLLAQASGRKVTLDWANSYLEGMKLIHTNAYHAVLVDYDLGSRTGLELIREAVSEGYPAALILYTGRGSFEVDIEAMQAGATAYLSKMEATPLLLERSIRYAIERKQIEEELYAANAALRKERAQLEAILNQMPAGVMIADAATGKLVIRNEQVEKIWGYSADADHAASFFQTYQGFHAGGQPYQPGEWPLSRALTHGEVVIDEEIHIQREDGSSGVMNVSASPVLDDAGNIQAGVVIFTDMTAHQRAEEALRETVAKLERSNQELEQFAFVASHDLQEPLRKIEAFSVLLQKRTGEVLGEEEHGYLERMRQVAARMQKMIDDLLALSRVTTRGKPDTTVDLSEIAKKVLDNLELQIYSSGGQVLVAQLPVIEADPLQMQQLLQNLVGNALKFHRKELPPVVTLSSKPHAANKVDIIVADNGIGFDMAYHDRIYQPFQRLHGRSEYEGTGIGLAICRKIVERHGGSIRAESTPGQGSTFIVILPVRQSG